jgi:hypothetical protein|tara:strand:- start:3177 stop:3335 length:159 start_codon:yes stop_codon:yes gene_type:complete
MRYAESVLDQIRELREIRSDALSEGKTTQAAHLQRAIGQLYDRYLALTGDVD